ncbi:MAG TPA: hypothetical protein VLT33_40845, partial [Labilithrix sp.]|nr:hypothetical protein [Labilithrix sp.]
MRTASMIAAAGLGLAALGLPSASSADEPASPVGVRVRVTAPGDCASDETFWSAVARHTSRLRLGTGADGALVELAVRREGDERVVGVLDVAPGAEPP